jgi:hypothetical protein
MELVEVGYSLDVNDVFQGISIELHSEGWKIYLECKRLGNITIKSMTMFLTALDLRPPAGGCRR